MGAIYVKPPVGTQLDWANPLTRKLVTCLPLWERAGRSLVDIGPGGNNGLLTTPAAPVWDGSPYGPSLAYDGAQGSWATIGSGNPANIAIGAGTPHTLAVVFRVTGYSGVGIVPGLIAVGETTFNRLACLELYDNLSGSTAKLRCEMYDGAGGPALQDTVDLIGQAWHTGVMTLDGSNMALYRDGTLVGTTSYSISTIDQPGTGWYLGARPDQYGGANFSGGTGFTGGIAMAVIATRAWAADEVRSFAGNPWQLFQSPAPWYLIEHASTTSTGSGAVTLGGLSVAGVGSSTWATGAITLGSLTASGAATFTATASGAITLGSLAASGTGRLTSSASGAVTLGSLSASGSATASAAGPTTATLTGPTSGLLNSASTAFTVTLDAVAGAGGVVVFPASTGGTDTFS